MGAKFFIEQFAMYVAMVIFLTVTGKEHSLAYWALLAGGVSLPLFLASEVTLSALRNGPMITGRPYTQKSLLWISVVMYVFYFVCFALFYWLVFSRILGWI
jgi:hypothetical protein